MIITADEISGKLMEYMGGELRTREMVVMNRNIIRLLPRPMIMPQTNHAPGKQTKEHPHEHCTRDIIRTCLAVSCRFQQRIKEAVEHPKQQTACAPEDNHPPGDVQH